jgi:molybdopterin-guanine dinucleotide biosynthesis protein A
VKEASLRKKMNRLTDVQLFLLTDGVDEIFDFVKEALPGWEKIPVFRWDERDKIISFFTEKMNASLSKLNGLVLAGGKSMRFGTDKGKIHWEGKELRYHLAELLQSFCEQVYISCRPEQQHEIEPRFETLPDTFTGLGPYGAILSAFRKQPDCAWLVIACDLPLLDEKTLRYLTDQRNSSSVGTAFESPHDGNARATHCDLGTEKLSSASIIPFAGLLLPPESIDE